MHNVIIGWALTITARKVFKSIRRIVLQVSSVTATATAITVLLLPDRSIDLLLFFQLNIGECQSRKFLLYTAVIAAR